MSSKSMYEELHAICRDGNVDAYQAFAKGKTQDIAYTDKNGQTAMSYCLAGRSYDQARRLQLDYREAAAKCVTLELMIGIEDRLKAGGKYASNIKHFLLDLKTFGVTKEIQKSANKRKANTQDVNDTKTGKKVNVAAVPALVPQVVLAVEEIVMLDNPIDPIDIVNDTTVVKRTRSLFSKKDGFQLLLQEYTAAFQTRAIEDQKAQSKFLASVRDEDGNHIVHLQYKEFLLFKEQLLPEYFVWVNYTGQTPIHMMAKKGDYTSLQRLRSCTVIDANHFHLKDDLGNNVLHYLVQHVPANPGEMKLSYLKDLIHDPNKLGVTPFHLAIKYVNGEAQNAMLVATNDASVNILLDTPSDHTGRTAAHYACEAGNLVMFQHVVGDINKPENSIHRMKREFTKDGENQVTLVVKHAKIGDIPDRVNREELLKYQVEKLGMTSTDPIGGVTPLTQCLLHGLGEAAKLQHDREKPQQPLTRAQLDTILGNHQMHMLPLYMDTANTHAQTMVREQGIYHNTPPSTDSLKHKEHLERRKKVFSSLEGDISIAMEQRRNKVTKQAQEAKVIEMTKVHARQKQELLKDANAEAKDRVKAAVVDLMLAQRRAACLDLNYLFISHKNIGCSFVWLLARMGLPTVMHRLANQGSSVSLLPENKEAIQTEEAGLIPSGKLENVVSEHGDTLLAACCCADSHTSITMSGLDSNSYANVANFDGDTPLHMAIKRKCSDDLLKALKSLSKLDVNVVNKAGETPQMLATRRGNQIQFKQLEAMVDSTRLKGNTKDCKDVKFLTEEREYTQKLILYASKYSSEDILRYLFSKPCMYKAAPFFTENGETPLYLACLHNHTAEAKYLYNHMRDFETRQTSTNQRTALHEAVKHRNVQQTSEQLRNNVQDVIVLDKSRMSPFFLAAKKGYVELVRLMYVRSTSDIVNKETGLPPCVDQPGMKYMFLHCKQRKRQPKVKEEKSDIEEMTPSAEKNQKTKKPPTATSMEDMKDDSTVQQKKKDSKARKKKPETQEVEDSLSITPTAILPQNNGRKQPTPEPASTTKSVSPKFVPKKTKRRTQ